DYCQLLPNHSQVGLYAAQNAVQLEARVALVTQSETSSWLPDHVFASYSLGEAGKFNDRLSNNPWLTVSDFVSLTAAQDWAKKTHHRMQTKNSLANLAALGVDVIVGKGEFCRLPNLAFQTEKRKLRSRNYVLATGVNFAPKFADSHHPQDYLTLHELWQQDLTSIGQNLIVVGDNPAALELSQILARFEKQVTLVTRQARILAHEDLELALLLQGELEASGIKVYTDSTVSQIKTLDGQKWLQVGDRVLTGDCIILTDNQQPNIAGLNLAGVDVKYDQSKVQVNNKLQTTNPHIYACGDIIGGYSLENIAQYEANLILKNTLFFPWYRVNYHSLPWTIMTQPSFARVGLNQKLAQQQYGNDLYMITEYFKDIDRGQISSSTTGMCKLLIRENGEILGCSLISDRAEELIAFISLMIQQQIKLDGNPMRGLTSLSLAVTEPSKSAIWQRAFNNFYRQKLQRHPQLRHRLRSWFSLRKG
ncbi:MAG: FAD-dependent oxidoreductase, partial [Cyanobacteria bacterium J06600_6]